MLQRDERRAIGRPGFEADLRHRRDSLGPFLHEVAAAEVHGEPDRVVDSVADLEVVPSGQGAPIALIQVVKTGRDLAQPHLGAAQEGQRPHPWHVCAGLLGGGGGFLRELDSGEMLPVERGQAGNPDVEVGESLAGAVRFEHDASQLELVAGKVAPHELPQRPAERDPLDCRFNGETRPFQVGDCSFEEAARALRLGVVVVSLAGAAEHAGALGPVRDIRRGPLEQLGRVAIGAGLQSVLRGGHRHRHRVLIPARHEQVVRLVDRRVIVPGLHHIGHARMQLLPAWRHEVFVDRLLRQGVPEPIAPRPALLLFDELRRHARFQSR